MELHKAAPTSTNQLRQFLQPSSSLRHDLTNTASTTALPILNDNEAKKPLGHLTKKEMRRLLRDDPSRRRPLSPSAHHGGDGTQILPPLKAPPRVRKHSATCDVPVNNNYDDFRNPFEHREKIPRLSPLRIRRTELSVIMGKVKHSQEKVKDEGALQSNRQHSPNMRGKSLSLYLGVNALADALGKLRKLKSPKSKVTDLFKATAGAITSFSPIVKKKLFNQHLDQRPEQPPMDPKDAPPHLLTMYEVGCSSMEKGVSKAAFLRLSRKTYDEHSSEQMFIRADQDQDGYLNLREFCSVFRE